MKPDPALAQIRKVRHRISARFKHDPKALVRHYQALQRQFKARVLRGHRQPAVKA